jgi:Domain of unknown function (DUF4157)
MSTHDIAEGQALRTSIPAPWTAPAAPALMRTQADLATDGVSCRLGDASCASAHAPRVSRSASGQRSSVHRSLLRLQRDYGNQFVGQVLRQADGGGGEAGGMDAIERSIDGARGGGHGMDHGTRSRMESAFGADFSGVRIHTDTRADTLSQSLSARAFTTGRDVFFRQGEYNPGASSGRELLAHELTHVVQQNGDGVQRKMTVSDPGDAHEVEADRMAQAVMQQEHAPRADRQGNSPLVVRQEDEQKAMTARHASDSSSVQRQPEMPKAPEEEEKKKLLPKLDGAVLSRQAEDEQAME